MTGGRTRRSAPRNCRPYLVKTVPCLHRFRAFRVAVEQAAQLLDTHITLSQFQKRETLFQLRGSVLVASGVLIQYPVVILNGALKISRAIVNLPNIKLGVSGEIGIAVDLEILFELLQGQIVLSRVEVAQGVVVQHIRRRSLILRRLSIGGRWSSRLGGGRILDVLHGALE